MRLFFTITLVCAFAPLAQAATFSEDVLPGVRSGDLIDPAIDPRQLEMLDLPVDLVLEAARRNFEEAIDILDRELAARADYTSILEVAPKIREYLPENSRLLWLHALALAATGSLEEARATLRLEAAGDIAGQSPLPLLAEAMIAFRSGDTENAAGLVSGAISRAPEHAYAHNLLGIISAELDGMGAARDRFAEAVRLSPASEVYWRNLGVAEFSQDRIESAANALQKALDLNETDCASLVALAQVYEAWRRLDDAEELAQRCLNLRTADRRAAGYLIRLQVAQNRFEAALVTATEHDEALANPAVVAAEIHLLMDRPEQALDGLNAAGDGNSVQRAFALAMIGDLDAATKELDVLSETSQIKPVLALADAAFSAAGASPEVDRPSAVLNSDDELSASLSWFWALMTARQEGAAAGASAVRGADGMLPGILFDGVPESDWAAMAESDIHIPAALGMLWLLRGYDQAASDAFDTVLDRAEVQQIRYFDALAEVRLGNLESARVRLEEATRQAPGYYSAQVLLGEVLLNLGLVEDALASYRAAVEVVEDGGALMKVGLLADHLDQPEVAEDALRRFIALYPESFIGYNQLAWVFVQRETRLDEALDLSRKADALQPGNASVLDNLGWIHHLRGEPDKALPILREANRRSGEANPDIVFHLAVVEAETGSRETSLKLLDRFAEIAPENHRSAARAGELRKKLQ